MSSETGVPREILTWMRGLQLPRTVRNPKRDLSNGFLVALICSRYWPEVSMHSYEDKLSEANKRSNWDMLRREFARNNCPISDRMIDGLIACRDDYANSLLRQLYTHLTGRVIVEAPPLPAPMVETPQTFMTHSNVQAPSTLSIDLSRTSADNSNVVTSRVRELPVRSMAALRGADHVSVPTTTKKRVFQAITDDKISSDLAALAIDDGQGENGKKPPMGFSVSLRRSEVQQTVVRPPPKQEKRKSQSADNKDQKQQQQQQQQVDRPSLGMYVATPEEVIESLVRKQAAGQDWPCARDNATAFTSYFLREEATFSALVQCRVWSSLFSNVNEVMESVFYHGFSLAKVAELFLATPSWISREDEQQQSPHSSQQEQNHWNHQQGRSRLPSSHSSSAKGEIWRKQAPSENYSIPQRYAFVASLLTSMSDADAFITASVYCEDILPHAKVSLCSLEYPIADIHAILLCAALPTDRKLAAKLLPDLLSAVYDALTGLNNIHGRCSFYLLLRSLLIRLSHGMRCSSSRSPFKRSGSVTSVSTLSEDDALTASIIAITGYNIVAALSHESPTVRLVGAHLATALGSTNCCPTMTLFHTVLPLLRESMIGTSILFHCVCAAWLRITVRCLNSPLSDTISTVSEGGEYEGLRTRAIECMVSMVNTLRTTLQMPGSKKMKIHIAEQLALCLDEFSSTSEMRQLFNADELAVSILTTLKTVPEGGATMFLSSPPSEDGRSRSQLGRLGRSRQSSCLYSPLLGPLQVNGSLRDCYPLALAEAVIVVFPPNEGFLSTNVSDKANNKRNSSGLSANTATTSPTADNVSTRQIMAKATALLRKRVVPEETVQRVKWMYRIIVSSRGDSEFPERPVSLTAEAAAMRWSVVMQHMYLEIAVLAAAAEMIFSQKDAMADTAANMIAQIAGMAQQVVLRWYTELHRDGHTLLQSTSNANGNAVRRASATTLNLQERLADAMLWYHKSFGGPAGQEQGQQQDKQRSNSISHRGAGRKMS
ncbi:uncharacterized protein TM35_000252140 [Trypanosoma theileri]|uniref:CH-like domain-containing protein n=1 Tax=Trypanosoma theileri TaxID=67003 RepID=A0A1X0NQW0_9TRYP|nr:uncharacterized protein TM35_000252140 [Trypanosoma theileri]ORC86918.1 hypothetical protein TM35_000252140 [Trypanosoma theileri]